MTTKSGDHDDRQKYENVIESFRDSRAFKNADEAFLTLNAAMSGKSDAAESIFRHIAECAEKDLLSHSRHYRSLIARVFNDLADKHSAVEYFSHGAQRGPRMSLDDLKRIYLAVEKSGLAKNESAAFSEVGEKFHLSSSAVKDRYYKYKKFLSDTVLPAYLDGLDFEELRSMFAKDAVIWKGQLTENYIRQHNLDETNPMRANGIREYYTLARFFVTTIYAEDGIDENQFTFSEKREIAKEVERALREYDELQFWKSQLEDDSA